MIPNSGALYLLGLQAAALATATFRLLTGTIPTDPTTTWATISGQEASWAGYAPQVAGTWAAPYQSGAFAAMEPVNYPSFSNTSAVAQTATGYALVAADGVTLIDFGPIALPLVLGTGLSAFLAYGVTDQQFAGR